MSAWGFEVDLYESVPDESARFVLGTSGSTPLVCIGVNPSTASQQEPDLTVRMVSNLVARRDLGIREPFDSFIMLNLTPERATNPRNLRRRTLDPLLKARNEEVIANHIRGQSIPVYAAWGGLIRVRTYLPRLLASIARMEELENVRWMARQVTPKGHPGHPIGTSNKAKFVPFDMPVYLDRLGW